MDYEKLYRDKLTTAEEAVKVVKSGDWVDYSWCVNHPYALDIALAARKEELEDVKVHGSTSLWMPQICKDEDAGEHFTWVAWHTTNLDRQIIKKGMGYFTPMRYSELPRFYREHLEPADVVMMQVPPMDRFGNFSFSVSPSHLAELCARAKHIIVEVNENLPRTNGLYDTELSVSRVDAIVEGPNPPLPQMVTPPPTDVDRKIAGYLVPQIPDGACLQLGIGGMPNAVGEMIARSDLKDLGIHTEMYIDAFVDIAEAGKITGRRKTTDRGRQVFGMAAGTDKLYRYIDGNPEVMGAPVEYTNDVRVIAANDNFISINSAIDIDLFSQVNAESAGIRHISGTGGQLDFVMGAYLSEGGKSFICLPSSYMDKSGRRKSRIRPVLEPGTICTTPRSAVQYIVTEYGMVNMKGKNTWQRAEGLIELAHPDFREELIREAEKMGIWRRSNRR